MKNSAEEKLSGSPEEFWPAIRAFCRWLDSNGFESYDPYDIWGTSYGKAARRLYYRKNPLGVPAIAPILLMEMLAPSVRKLFVKPTHYPTADAQLLLAFLNLNSLERQPTHLSNARKLADALLATSVPGFRGHCWGYPFDWTWNSGIYPKNTPFITATPYCFEGFLGLHECTGESRFEDVARSSAEFICHDLRDTPTGPNEAAGSYSPVDSTKVFNASAYRAFVMIEAGARWNVAEYHEKGLKNLNFILNGQREDGAWLYALDNPAEAFIDHFHTCFVLKNLWKCNQRLRDKRVEDSLRRGVAYYMRELFGSDGLPKSFSIVPRTQLARLEMYNFAEAITLGSILKNDIPEAFELAVRLAREMMKKHQVSEGYFVTRVFAGGLKHRFPFMRWPQAQMFYAFTNLVTAISKSVSAAESGSRKL